MSTNKFFRFSKTTANNDIVNIRKKEIILKVVSSSVEDSPNAVKVTKDKITYVAPTPPTPPTPSITVTITTPPITALPARGATPAVAARPQRKITVTYSILNPDENSTLTFDNAAGKLILSINLDDSFYPISSIFWGRNYNSFKCENKEAEGNKFGISDSSKLPFVIDSGIMKISFPIDIYATELGVNSLEQAIKLNCAGDNSFVVGKIVVLYTTETNDSEKIVATTGTRELFTQDNKYIGIY
jgi:hypothetical protein